MRPYPLIISFFTLFLSLTSGAQVLDPVDWSYEVRKTETGHELVFKAAVEKGWHLYSHYIEDGGPVPTSFYFEENKDISLIGSIVEKGKKISKYDDLFGMELAWFDGDVEFIQPVRLASGSTSTLVKGELEFMVCDDHQCLPPELVPFAFNIRSSGEAVKTVEKEGRDMNIATETVIQIDEAAPMFTSPVTWQYQVEKAAGSDRRIRIRAEIEDGWHLYSTTIGDEGPIPTTFIFEPAGNMTLSGPVAEEGDKVSRMDDIFGIELSWFDTAVDFVQDIGWDGSGSPVINGSLEFMVCNDAECLPPDLIEFSINLADTDVWKPLGTQDKDVVPAGLSEIPEIMQPGEFNTDKIRNDCTGQESDSSSRNYWIIFLLGFGGGLIALLTPCVFPMIPLTVSFFTKGSEKSHSGGVRNALIYGISIVIIYVSLGLAVTLGFGPEMLNWIATDPWFNVFFFLIFVFFAFSFFGFYELNLPSSWTNKTDRIASKGGLVGIFFMAFTLALVSFSCTGPIIGSLIVEAVRQGVQGPLFGMLGFAVALALPFTLFAIFPRWLNSLPQSGGWLNSVKVFLGFLELAFALKFFSTADLTRHWGILKYELFIGLWIIIFILLGLYMFRLIRFPHDSKSAGGPSGLRMGVGAGAFIFSAYLIFGLVNYKPLLGGIAPAPGYSFLKPSKCPEGVNICFHDYEEGMAYAKKLNKAVMLDFTGYGCVNCRLMENNVWKDKEVNKLLNEYVIISLYVDDRADLPEEKHYVSDATGKTKDVRKVGKYWHDFQFRHFGTLSQPYYVLVSPDSEVLNKPVAYTPNKEDYMAFLECGLKNLADVCPECRITGGAHPK